MPRVNSTTKTCEKPNGSLRVYWQCRCREDTPGLSVEAPLLAGGGAAGAADLGSSSKYSSKKQTLNVEVEEGSSATAFARGLGGNLSLKGNQKGLPEGPGPGPTPQ